MRHDRAERPPLCSQPSRMAALTYAHAAALRSAADLAHQQLIGRDQRERWPRGYHPSGRCRLGDRHIGRQARRATRHQQRPRKEAATAQVS